MIVLDVESTGLNTSSVSIVSLGALDFHSPENQFYGECHIWDGAEIEDAALVINGFTRAQILDIDKPSEADLITSFVAWAHTITDRTLVAQNVSFDLELVQSACKRAGVACPFGKRTIDTHSLVWMHMTEQGRVIPQKNNHSDISLDTGLAYCGLPAETKPHNALTGARAHAEILARVAYNKNILSEFSTFPIPWTPLERTM